MAKTPFPGWVATALLATLAVASTAPAEGGDAAAAAAAFSLRIIHTNDMHSRFEQISEYGGKCLEWDLEKNKCYGGYPRLATAVREERRNALRDGVPILFLNAGDTYQGTAWYTIHKWRVVSELTNLLTIDAMSLGNHEFDDGVPGLVPFLEEARFPVVTCNLDLEDEPELRGKVKPSHVFDVSGRRVGVVGYLTPETMALSQTDNVTIYDEIANVTAAARALKESGVDIIIAVGHSGFEVDLRIARSVPDVDVVVGGHTNTFLYTGTPPAAEVPANLYPAMVTQASGRRVAVVQAFAYTKYLGILNVNFTADGEVAAAYGNPRLLDHTVAEDPDMLEAMKPWGNAIANLTKKALGKSKVFLDGSCRFFECNFGNLIADAFIDYGVANHVGEGWTNAPIALQQAGGIRAPIDATSKKGTVTMEDVIISMPFYNTLSIVNITGKYLLEALEWSVARYDPHHTIGRGEFLQFSGLKVLYDLSKAPGERVVSASARCGRCPVPRFAPVEADRAYGIIMPSFLAKGGDNFTMFEEHGTTLITFDKVDTEVVADFIAERRIIYADVQDRIAFVGFGEGDTKGGSRRAAESSSILVAPLLLLLTLKCT